MPVDRETSRVLAAAVLAWSDLPAWAGPDWPAVRADLADLLRAAVPSGAEDVVATEARLVLLSVRAVARRLDAQPVPAALLDQPVGALLARLAVVAGVPSRAAAEPAPDPAGDPVPALVVSAPDRVVAGDRVPLELRLAGRPAVRALRVVVSAPGCSPGLVAAEVGPGAAAVVVVGTGRPGRYVVDVAGYAHGRLAGTVRVAFAATTEPGRAVRLAHVAPLEPGPARYGDLAVVIRGGACLLVSDDVERHPAPVPGPGVADPWTELVAPGLRGALLARLPRVRRLVVHADRPTVPWESIRPLTDRVPVCRWAAPHPPPPLAPGPVVAPGTLDRLLATFRAGTAGVVRVDGAAAAAGGEPALLVGGEPFVPSYLDGADLGGALVVLGPTGAAAFDPDAWARTLLRARAGAVAVPDTAVPGDAAEAYARALLDALAGGVALGEAAARARRDAGAAYRMYGDPAATRHRAAEGPPGPLRRPV